MGSLDQAIEKAWRAFDRSTGLTSRITHVAPILFFGDLDAYGASPLRILTVGLNPSLHEFPVGEPFRRFPLLTGVSSDREPGRYLNAMTAYFRTDPYRVWFDRGFEKVLNGAGASYYKGAVSTALHTDICSPVPTSPTWSKLGPADRAALEAEGGPLWHMLLEALRPNMVVLSVAKSRLKRIQFTPMTEWKAIYTSKHKKDGTPRQVPYKICARWYEVGGERSLFVFGPAGNTPFEKLDDDRKRKAGAIVRKRFEKTIGTASLSAAFRRAPSP